MGKKKADSVTTIRDVARLAGTGTTAVSRFFSSKGYLAAATRERIAKVVEATGFRLNRNASLLKSRTNRQLALIIGGRDRVRAWTTHFFMGEKFIGVVEEAVAQGWEVLLLPLDPWEQDAAEVELRRQHFAGALLFEPVPEAFTAMLSRWRIPFVTSNFEMGRGEGRLQFYGEGTHAVVTDYGGIPAVAASFAVSRGYAGVAFSPGWYPMVHDFDRLVGQAAAAHGLADLREPFAAALQNRKAPEPSGRLLLVCDSPEAVQIAHPWLAPASGKLGLLAFNNYPQFAALDPQVSFLYQDGGAIGRESVRRLLSWIGEEAMAPASVYLPVTLEDRGSA